LIQIILKSVIAFEQSSDVYLPALDDEDGIALGRRRHLSFETRRDHQTTELVDQLLDQWPCQEPHLSHRAQDGCTWLFDVSSLMKKVQILFQSWYQNAHLHGHVQEVQKILDGVHLPDEVSKLSQLQFTPCTSRRQSPFSAVTFDWLLKRDPPKMDFPLPIIPNSPAEFRECTNPSGPDTTRSNLKLLFSEFESSTSPLHRRYGCDLDSSRRSLDSSSVSDNVSIHIPPLLEALTEYRDQSMRCFRGILSSINESLSPRPSSIPEATMLTAGQWPCITKSSLLGKLTCTTNAVLTDPWRKALVKLAQGLLVLQRSQRLLHFALTQNDEELSKELANGSYDIHEYPDWLLIQVNIQYSSLNARGLIINDQGGK
jgi:hypothetical protein